MQEILSDVKAMGLFFFGKCKTGGKGKINKKVYISVGGSFWSVIFTSLIYGVETQTNC